MLGTSNEETKIKKTQIILAVITLALSPIFLAQSAFGETKAEYSAKVEEAKAVIDAAQNALTLAQEAYQLAVDSKAAIDATVESNKTILDNKILDVQSKQLLVDKAQASLDLAKENYNTKLISDPNWIRPDKEVTQTIDVAYTVQVPYTELVPRVELVPRTVLIPYTEMVPYLDYEPVEVTRVVPGGLIATSYNRQGYNNAPPLPTDTEIPLATENVPNINFQWGGGLVLNSGKTEDVLVKFEGNLMVPEDNWYSFYAPADDGVKLTIAGMNLINDWRDKGGGGSISEPMWIRAGIFYPTTLYYYENGGGAFVQFYSQVSGGNMEIVPATWFGETTVTETIYQPVVKYQEVTYYREEIVYDEVIVYDEITLFREETRYRKEDIVVVVPDEDATAPLINDPALAIVVGLVQIELDEKQSTLLSATTDRDRLQQDYESSLIAQAEKAGIIEVASQDVIIKQEELLVAEQELQAIPPFREPTPTPEETEEPVEEPETPEPEPLPEPEPPVSPEPSEPELPVNIETVDPATLSNEQVAELVSVANEILNNSEQGSPEYEEALDALFVAAQANDIELSEELAAIPGAEALVGAINFIGNVGADMSPKVREESEKIVVTAVVAVGAAVNAATGAALSAAAPSAPASSASTGGSGGTSGIRRRD